MGGMKEVYYRIINKVARATRQDKRDVEEELEKDPDTFITKYADHLTKEERQLVSPISS